MRLINADELLNKTAELEAVALEQVGKYEPLADKTPSEWHRWTGILQERTAFKYDLMDAPTIEAEPIRHGRWLWVDGVRCSICNHKLQTTGLTSYCPNCGAKMDEGNAETCWQSVESVGGDR